MDIGVEARIKQILHKRIGMSVEAITSEAKLVDDLGVDSLDFVELVIATEEAFGVSISEELFSEVKTVRDVAELVEHLAREQVAAG